jgi:GNAT superfamily N-acetyltransferase
MITYQYDVTHVLGALDQLVGLHAELSPRAERPDRNLLISMAQYQDVVKVISAWDSLKLVGMITVVMVPLMSYKATIEDLVVTESHRGQRIAKEQVDLAKALARTKPWCHWLTLNSRPERTRANQFYTDLGFVATPTNNYQLPL